MEGAPPSAPPVEDGYNEYVAPTRRRKKKSKVWNEFEEGLNDKREIVSATCEYCKMVLVFGSTKGTSHLKRHLEKCPMRPLGLPLGKGGQGDKFVFDMNALRENILLYVVEGNHPFLTVEERGFNRMMLSANPEFKSISRLTLARDLFLLYQSERENLKELLLKAPGFVSLTTDNWKSSHTPQHYICITTHFVDIDWKLHKRILRFRNLLPPFDGSSIGEEIYLFLKQWQLKEKILSITMDNASYNEAMIRHLKLCINGRGMFVGGGRFFHVRCCAHIINLIVQCGLRLIDDILEVVRRLVKEISRSSTRSKDFYEAVKTFHLNEKRRLRLDMKIRWNSTYKMLNDVLYYKDVFIHLGSVDAHFKSLVPSYSAWAKLLNVHKFLKVFYEVTCMFSSVKSTSNLFFKGAYMVHHCLVETSRSPHVYLADMIPPMLENFEKYWCEYNINILCVAVLDPRFKVKFIEYCLNKLFGEEIALRQVSEVLDTLKSLYHEYKLQGSASPIVVAAPATDDTEDSMFDDFSTYKTKSTSKVTT